MMNSINQVIVVAMAKCNMQHYIAKPFGVCTKTSFRKWFCAKIWGLFMTYHNV